MTNEPSPTPALEAAARRRRELRDALVAFEDALASPIRDRVSWRAEAADALAHLARAFDEHVAETEGRGGLYEEMSETAPHVAAKANRLREEHPQIAASLAEAARALSTPLPDEAAIDALRDELQRVMGRIVRHRQHGADLVWEAYAVDIGNAG
jgi:exonuclease VII large subunit